MPVVSVSLSEIGFEGYKSIPKGLRSKLVDKLLREYALKSQSVVLPFGDRAVSVQSVMENHGKMSASLKSQGQVIRKLKEELEELKE